MGSNPTWATNLYYMQITIKSNGEVVNRKPINIDTLKSQIPKFLGDNEEKRYSKWIEYVRNGIILLNK